MCARHCNPALIQQNMRGSHGQPATGEAQMLLWTPVWAAPPPLPACLLLLLQAWCCCALTSASTLVAVRMIATV